MFAGLMLLAAASGHVVETGPDIMVVRVAHAVQPGDTLVVKKLEPAFGPPGRLPFFQWSKAAKLRVTAVRADGHAEVALVHGSAAPGDRVEAD